MKRAISKWSILIWKSCCLRDKRSGPKEISTMSYMTYKPSLAFILLWHVKDVLQHFPSLNLHFSYLMVMTLSDYFSICINSFLGILPLWKSSSLCQMLQMCNIKKSDTQNISTNMFYWWDTNGWFSLCPWASNFSDILFVSHVTPFLLW